MKPMLACNADRTVLVFPLITQPKIDGVRALNIGNSLFARSLKPIRNKHTRESFYGPWFCGFDGELAAGFPTHPDLCRMTTSATSAIKGEPEVYWHVFDDCAEETRQLPYASRLAIVEDRIHRLRECRPFVAARLRIVPSVVVKNFDELEERESWASAQGYEGLILRSPNQPYKSGRSTIQEAGLLRIKDFTDSEATVVGVTEGLTNENEAQTNELGLTFRSSHQENQFHSRRVGSIQASAVSDVIVGNRLVISKGQRLTISPGNMDTKSRIFYWKNQSKIIGKTIKFKFFAKGIKDKPRFPTFVCFRDLSDL